MIILFASCCHLSFRMNIDFSKMSWLSTIETFLVASTARGLWGVPGVPSPRSKWFLVWLRRRSTKIYRLGSIVRFTNLFLFVKRKTSLSFTFDLPLVLTIVDIDDFVD